MAKKPLPKLLIIDGNALIHRSFHALPPTLTTKKGEMVNAVYGFTMVLIKALKEIKPEYVILTLDKKGPTFRHQVFKEYKAQRIKAPKELYQQISKVKAIANAFSIPIYSQKGYEADDLIGSICFQVGDKAEKIILTGDLDVLQLVNDNTKVYTMHRGLSDHIIYDEAMVRQRFGLKPCQLVDFKALRGDPSDNIPGVRGVGEKTAITLLQHFGTLENVYSFLDKKSNKEPKFLTARLRRLLLEHKQEAFLSKKLATIKTNLPLEINLKKARFGKFNQDAIVCLFQELEFKSLLPRLHDLSPLPKVPDSKFIRNQTQFNYHLIEEEKDFQAFLKRLKRATEFVFDTETATFNPLDKKILGISFSWQEAEAYYLNLSAKSQQPNLFDYQEKNINQTWLNQLKPIFNSARVKKMGHNLKYDLRVLRHLGIEVNGLDFDTMLASYLLNPGSRQHSLDALVFSELTFTKISKEDLLIKDNKKTTFGEVETKKLSLYSCEDADFTYRLVKKLRPQLQKSKQEKLFKEIEMPLIKVLAQMEDNGIKVDSKFLAHLEKRVTAQLNKLERQIWKLADSTFNVRSTQQLREVLFNQLKISTKNISKTKTGYSTAAEELEKLKGAHPIIPLIQEHRELSKLLNTYIQTLPNLIDKRTGRVHTSFNQAVTATGRLSSSNPNLQNIPIRTDWGRQIRRAFVAERGYLLLSLDYSQIELRLAAHLSADPRLIRAFQEGKDIHTATAAEINGIKIEKVTPQLRRAAKAINFGILYGQGPQGLAQAADISLDEAKHFITKYFNIYQGVKEFIERAITEARQRGYTETLLGRRRYLPEINSSVIQIRKAAERMAINAPLQGTAADIIKKAMVEIHQFLSQKYSYQEARMLLQVHDELLFEVKKEKAKRLAAQIKPIMENIFKLKVPLVAEVKMGKSWGELKELK